MILRLASALGLGLSLTLVLWMTIQTRADVDLWGHIRFGLDILDSGTLQTTDAYSFTSDRQWINHEWLTEVAVAFAWRLGGTPTLILLKLACIGLALALVGAALSERRIRDHRRIILLGLTLLGILPRVAHVRPQLFSVLLFATLLRVLIRADAGHTRALLWTVPILTLWANFHGGWLVGVATVAVWCAGEAYASRARPANAGFALACAAAALAATLLNPYGVRLWQFLFETVRLGRHAIREWGPAWTDAATTIVWTLFALLLVAALWRTRQPRNPASVLIPIVWGAAALRVGRLDAFFAMSVIGLLAEPVSSLFVERARHRNPLPRVWQFGAVGLALLTIVGIPYSRGAFSCIGLLTPRWPEPQAVEFIHQRQLSGRVVTYFDWGEYAIWHLQPRLKVSMDGRRETVYSDRVITGHLELYAGTNEGLAYLRELAADYVWLPGQLAVIRLLRQDGWVVIFDGPHSTLLGRPGSTGGTPATVVRAEPRARCFPGP